MWQRSCKQNKNSALRAALVSLAAMVLSGCSFNQVMQLPDFSATAEPVGVSAPASVQRQYRKAVASMEQGDLEKAEAQLQAFVVDHPSYANAYVNLAIVTEERGDIKTAERLLQQAVMIDEANVYALNRLGLIQRRAGDFAAAEQSWLEVTRVEAEYPNAWYNLGVLYELYLRDLQAALDHYQRYQDLTGGAPDASVARWITDLERRIGDAPKTASASPELL